MGKNFMAMPPLLKLLTSVAIVVPVFCVVSMFPRESIEVFGRQMSTSEWWSSGAGLTTLVVGGFMLAAAILMLRRSRYGRPAYILGWIALNLSAPLVAHLTGTEFPGEMPSLMFAILLAVLISVYFYKSSAVHFYLHTETKLN
ncbi:MAG TPA: hypothetical protein VMV40_01795 [Acidiferrobacter sp.]|nr:hypothetical protein [Acidiferrobacter sp.]